MPSTSEIKLYFRRGAKSLSEHDWDQLDKIYDNPVFRAMYGIGRGTDKEHGSWMCRSCTKYFHYHDVDRAGNCPNCRWGVVKRVERV